jgi:uncharacterized protein YndB with AHSA1/START domain
MSDDATLHTVNGQPTLRFERRLAHAPEKVWRAVSDPAEMAHWFPAAVETELRPGSPMRFRFAEDAPLEPDWDGEVLEVDPPRVYMFRWAQDVLRFELLPDGDGCLLVFTQTVGGGRVGLLGAGRTAAGWVDCLDVLAGRLDGVPVAERTDWVTPMRHYIEKFHLDEGTVRAVDGGFELHFARDLVWKPLDQVWQTLTEDAVGDLLPQRAANDHVPAGPIVAAEAPKLLEYQWLHEGEPVGTVRWEFVSDPKLGVRVELTQTVPAELASVRAEALAAWQVHLDLFFAAVQGDVRCAWSEERVAELTKRYEATLD